MIFLSQNKSFDFDFSEIEYFNKLSMNTKAILTTLFFVFTVSISAQESAKQFGVISGTIYESITKQKVNSINATLLSASDSSAIFKEERVIRGNFKFSKVPFGLYIIKISGEKFNTIYIDNVKLSKYNPSLKYPKLYISYKKERDYGNEEVLEFVQQFRKDTASRSTFQIENGKLTIFTDKESFAKGGNILDIVLSSPFAALDVTNELTINGKRGATISINNSPVHLSGGDAAHLLSQIPAERVEKIVINEHPSISRNSSGLGGEIEIFLKNPKNTKYKKIGADANIGVGDKSQGNGGFNFTVTDQKFELFAQANYNGYKTEGPFDFSVSKNGNLATDAASQTDNFSKLFISAGAIIKPNKNHTINVYGLFLQNQIKTNNSLNYFIPDNVNHFSFSNIKTYAETDNDNKENSYEINLNYEGKIGKSGNSINFDLSYGSNQTKTNKEMKSIIYDMGQNVPITGDINSDNDFLKSTTLFYSGSLFYTLKTKFNSKVTLGVFGNSFDNSFEHENAYIPWSSLTESKIKDINKKRFGAWLNYCYTSEKIRVSAGLQASSEPTIESSGSTKFLILPDVKLKYNLTPKQSLTFVINKNINDLAIKYLNPQYSTIFPFNVARNQIESDIYETILQAELGWQYLLKKGRISTSIFYHEIENPLSIIVGNHYYSEEYSKDIPAITINYVSLKKREQKGIKAQFLNKLTPEWQLLMGGSIYEQQITSNFSDTVELCYAPLPNERKEIGWDFSLNNQFEISKNFLISAGASFYGPETIIQGSKSATYIINSGIIGQFLDKQLELSLSFRNILNSAEYNLDLKEFDDGKIAISPKTNIAYFGICWHLR